MNLTSATMETYINLIHTKLTQIRQISKRKENAIARRNAAQEKILELERKLNECKKRKSKANTLEIEGKVSTNNSSNSNDNTDNDDNDDDDQNKTNAECDNVLNNKLHLLKQKVKEYNIKWSVLMSELTLRNKILSHTLKYVKQDMMKADISLTSHWLDHWGEFFTSTNTTLREMKQIVKQVHAYETEMQELNDNENNCVTNKTQNSLLLMPLETVSHCFDDVCHLQLQVRSIVGRERYRRHVEKMSSLNHTKSITSEGSSHYNDNSEEMCKVQELLDNQAQLLDWCATQSELLHSLHNLSELHTFVKSLHANVKIMDNNFLMLLEQSKHIVEHKETVHEALRAAQRAWITLCCNTYSMIRREIVTCHSNTEVEKMCTLFNDDNVIERALQYLDNARQALTSMQDKLVNAETVLNNAIDSAHHKGNNNNNNDNNISTEMQRLQLVSFTNSIHEMLTKAESLLEECDKLVNETNSFAIVTTHLSDFNVREKCVRPHFEALQQELLSDVTTTVLCLPSEVEYEGKAEYINRMDELREWIDVKSQKGTYLKLLDRINEMKKVVNQYPDKLFPENNEQEEEEEEKQECEHQEESDYLQEEENEYQTEMT